MVSRHEFPDRREEVKGLFIVSLEQLEYRKLVCTSRHEQFGSVHVNVDSNLGFTLSTLYIYMSTCLCHA